MPEGIYKVFFEEIVEAISFFFRETSILKWNKDVDLTKKIQWEQIFDFSTLVELLLF